ncbi:MAG: hypothetical protein PHW04_00490 [Candidatus Wallbacteria bacterium]|nr:hypothetical protein [Candidatus Wallbacteria bacterium]
MERYLENIDFGLGCNTLGGALWATLSFYGIQYPRSSVMGLSSLAFRLNMTPDCSPCCQTIFDLESWLANVSPLLGLHFELDVLTAGNEFDKMRRETATAIDKNLQSGNPVIFFDPLVYEWCLINGYSGDTDEYYLTATDGESTITGAELWDRENSPMLWFIFPRKGGKIPEDSFIQALNLSLTHFRSETPDRYFREAGYAFGESAWDLWISSLKKGKVNEYGLGTNLRLVRSAREDARNFLLFLSENLPEFKSGFIGTAITCLRNTGESISRIEDLFVTSAWTDDCVKTDDPRLPKTLEWLEQALEHEKQTFDQLEKYLSSQVKE